MVDPRPAFEPAVRLMRPLALLALHAVFALLSACGGGDSGSGPDGLEAPQGATLSVEPVKTFRFDWTDVEGATHYQLLENPDGMAGFSQVGGDIPQGLGTAGLEVPLYARLNARYILQACSASECVDADPLLVNGTLEAGVGYFKAGDTHAQDLFGSAVALSADGQTLAVGAVGDTGAVYVFTREGGTWRQAVVKADNAGAGDHFGSTLALSPDGRTLAVGATGEDSTGIDDDRGDSDAGSDSGAVYLFTRGVDDTWRQQAMLKAGNAGALDAFGVALALSADGDTLAVGAFAEDSEATGIDGDPADSEAGTNSGAVYVYTRADGTWQPQAYIKADDTGAQDFFGSAVALSKDGDTLAVGAFYKDGLAAAGQVPDATSAAGAVYVFVRESGAWRQQEMLRASNAGGFDFFGSVVALSEDGDTLAVGAYNEDSGATGIDGDQADSVAGSNSGAVYLFTRDSGVWQQQAYIKAGNTGAGDNFGIALALSADGQALAVGAPGEDRSATGINGDPANSGVGSAFGAAYVFARGSGAWRQQAYVKASNTGAQDQFGVAVALSADGRALAVGAIGEASAATGVGGDQADDSVPGAGAVYLY